MLQPWEQNKMEELTEEQMKKDENEICKEVYALWHIFNGQIKEPFIKKLQIETFKNNTKNWTILEEALKLQKIIEMYLEFITETGKFSVYSVYLTIYLERIDDVLVVLQKFYKKLEEKFAIKLIKKGG